MATFCLLGMCLPGLCVLGELYVKYQRVVLVYNPLSQKCMWPHLHLLTGRSELRAFQESASWILILSFPLNLTVNWIFVYKWKDGKLHDIYKIIAFWENDVGVHARMCGRAHKCVCVGMCANMYMYKTYLLIQDCECIHIYKQNIT